MARTAAALCGRCSPCLRRAGRPPAEARDLPLAGTRSLSPPPTPAPLLARAAAPLSSPARQVVVRGVPVQLPETEDVPCGYGGSFEETAKLLWVNGWMAAHARVKPYDGRAGRGGYTDGELAGGRPVPSCPHTARVLRGKTGAVQAPLREGHAARGGPGEEERAGGPGGGATPPQPAGAG